MINKMLLRREFFPRHEDNLMMSEGDVALARKRLLQERPRNLLFLLQQRFSWMNEYLEGKKNIIELGSGAGFLRNFIDSKNLRLTDVKLQPWIDEQVDALNMPYENSSLDVIICSHMIHHLANPKRFFLGVERVLKPGGLVLISEVNTSLLMRTILRIMKHEGWSYDVNVFDENVVCNQPHDPWSANTAIPEMLFSNTDHFEQNIPAFKIIKNSLTECTIFPLSGGVIAKTKTVQLPQVVLRLFNNLDKLLITFFPSVFAMGRRVVLQKNKT